jgi:hypothetical protein
MISSRHRRIVRESEWMTVYQDDTGELYYESKFLVSGLAVSADSLRRRWQDLPQREKYDFVHAFQAKPLLTSDDEEILDFLMEVRDINIWITISPLLPRHSNRQRVLDFLLERIVAAEGPKANFFQAIETLDDTRALNDLRRVYLKYDDVLNLPKRAERIEYLDYLQCCRALWTLSGAHEYEQVLKKFLSDDDEDIRRWAERLLAAR